MSTVSRDDGNGAGTATSLGRKNLRDELASLKIERKGAGRTTFDPMFDTTAPQKRRRGTAGRLGLGLLTLLLWLIPFGLVGGGSYYAYNEYQKYRPKIEVTTMSVQRMTSGEAEKLLSAKGYIRSRYQADIGAKAPGRVQDMLVEEGVKVKQGDLLAVLEHEDLTAQLESRQMMIERTKAERDEAGIDFEDKKQKYDRWSRLRALNQVSVDETETYKAAYNKAKFRLQALEIGIRLQDTMIKEAKESIENMKIYAPFDGTVVSKGAEKGETITPGGMGAASGRGSVVKLANLSVLDVETDVSEGLLDRIEVGQPAEISVSAVPSKRYKGHLRTIIPMGDRAKGTVMVKVAIDDPDDKLFPELAATVHFLPNTSKPEAETGKSYLFVQKSGIVEENGQFFAWVVSPKNILEKREVEVVITNDLARVEKGLSSGENIVNNPAKTLRAGELVKEAK